MPPSHEIPDEVRRKFVRLRQELDVAIKLREEFRRRRAAVSPKIWSMAMRHVKPNLRTLNSEISNIEYQLVWLIQQHGESVKDSVARTQSDVAGDPLHLQKPVMHSKLYGHGVQYDGKDFETDV